MRKLTWNSVHEKIEFLLVLNVKFEDCEQILHEILFWTPQVIFLQGKTKNTKCENENY